MGDMTAIGAPIPPAQVMVAVRLRPLLATDRPHEMICAQALPYTQQVVLGHNCYHFQMDSSFPMDSTQSQVFDTAVAPLMDRLLQGYDVSVVTYGQSKAGKTHTILGPGVNHCHVSEKEYGIIPRAARYIFTRTKQGPPKKVKITISFLEIQNEKIRDLLTSSQHQSDLFVLESDAGYPVVTGLQEVSCESLFDLFGWLQMGMENRHLEWNNTRLVGHPSHSHCVFTLCLEQQWITQDGTVEQRLSVARFADLASSEKIFYKGINGEIIGEPVHLDPGLIALSNVVSSISQLSPWPSAGLGNEMCLYRQSTLTKILKESFGGRSFSLIICCISPASLNFDESLMTLKFAERLRNIRNYPILNALSVKVNLERPTQEPSAQSITVEGLPADEIQADVFGLEFAASQWMKLVDSAEGLFSRLVKNNTLTEKEKGEIEKWLCLKHECEECVGSEGSTSVVGNEGRLLEKIDEVTETEEKTDSSKEVIYDTAHGNDKVQYESESESEADSQQPEFTDRLFYLLEQFKEKTDNIVLNQKDFLKTEHCEGFEKEPEDIENETIGQHPVRSCLPSSARRKSIHPGTQLPLIALALSHHVTPSINSGTTAENNDEADEKVEPHHDKSFDEDVNQKQEVEQSLHKSNETQLEPQQALKLLSAGNEEKQNQIKQVLRELEGAYKRKEELQATIQIKEQFIQDMNNNADTRSNARQRFQRKKTKLEEEYYKTRTQLAQAQHALFQTASPSEENTKCKKEVEKYKKKASRYEKRLKNMEIINQIAGDSARKVLELEQSLHRSKRQMEKLKQRLKREEARKFSLERELHRDQQKLSELREKYDIQASRLEEQERNASVEGSQEENCGWIKKEEERLLNLRASSQQIQEQLQQIKSNLEKREASFKERICMERQRTRSLMDKSARLSHHDQASNDKLIDLEKIRDEDEREAIRAEIYNLRSTRDLLLDNRCELDSKFQKEKTLSNLEERKLIECDEAIEAIDAAIEYKNELICGRKGGLDATGEGKGEKMLMDRLHQLSLKEMQMLLYKYFQKVIDLRESGRKLEVQLSEKEHLTEAQTWTIQHLNNALQHQKLEAERQIVFLQYKQQEKLHLVLRTFAEESSTGGGASSGTEMADSQRHRMDRYETNLKAENRRTKQKLAESALAKMQSSRKSGAVTHNIQKDLRSRSASPEPIPNKNLKQLQAAATSLTTKVTRQKNKLIIQQQKPNSSRSKQTNS